MIRPMRLRQMRLCQLSILQVIALGCGSPSNVPTKMCRCENVSIRGQSDGSPRFLAAKGSWDDKRDQKGWWGALIQADDCTMYHGFICADSRDQATQLALENAHKHGVTKDVVVVAVFGQTPDGECQAGELGPEIWGW